MGVKKLNRTTEGKFHEAINRLRDDSKPEWGSLNAAGMLRHLRQVFDYTTGDSELELEVGPFRRFSLRMMFIDLALPWPRGVKISGVRMPSPDGSVDQERPALFESIETFIARAEAEPDLVKPHPVFGRISLRAWNRIHGLHCRHHLSQFGVWRPSGSS